MKNPLASARDSRGTGLILGLGRLPEEEMATYSVLLLEKSHGQRSLVGSSPYGHKKFDMTEQVSTQGTDP